MHTYYTYKVLRCATDRSIVVLAATPIRGKQIEKYFLFNRNDEAQRKALEEVLSQPLPKKFNLFKEVTQGQAEAFTSGVQALYCDAEVPEVEFDTLSGATDWLVDEIRDWEKIALPRMFEALRISSDYGVVTAVETNREHALLDSNARFFEFNSNVPEQRKFFETEAGQKNAFTEITRERAMSYYSGIGDGLGHGRIPNRKFSSLEELTAWVIAMQKDLLD